MTGISTLAQTYKQKQQQLEQKKSALYQDVRLTEELLTTTKANRKASINELSLLENQIEKRAQVIGTIKEEISLLSTGIQSTSGRIDSLQQQLILQKEAYAKLVRNAYFNHTTYNKLLFLFSSKDFNEAYRRFKYVQYYSKYRKSQFKTVQQAKYDLENMLVQLRTEQQQQRTLLTKEEEERQTLVQKEQEKEQLIGQLKKKEKHLIGNIDQKRAALTELDQQIQAVIEQALAEARAKARAAAEAAARKRAAELAKKEAADVPPPNVRQKPQETHTLASSPAPASTPKTPPTLSLTPEATKLANKFASNRGKLPWPVQQGVITEKFGTNRHPLFKQITTKNNGINIATAPNSQVRALFDGQVTNVLFNPSFQWAVIVNHGNYFTVYANLREVLVNKKDKIKTKQALGVVHTNEAENKTEVHLEIWKESKKLNPAKWIFRK